MTLPKFLPLIEETLCRRDYSYRSTTPNRSKLLAGGGGELPDSQCQISERQVDK